MYKALNFSRSAAVSSFGKSMALGGAVSLSDRLIFRRIRRADLLAQRYDVYTGEGWLNTDSGWSSSRAVRR